MTFISHPSLWSFGSLMQQEETELSPPWFGCRFLPISIPRMHFGGCWGEWEGRGHNFGVWGGRFYPFEKSQISLPHFSTFFLFYPRRKTRFWVASEWEKRPAKFGCCWVRFGHIRAINGSRNWIATKGLFLRILVIHFVGKTILPQPRILYSAVCAFLLWSKLVGSGIGSKWAW